MEETLNDSLVSVDQEVSNTEPANTEPEIQETDNSKTKDPWNEDFNVEENMPEVEGQEEVSEDTEPADEKPADMPEYITEGLGELDNPLVVKVKGKVYDLKNLDQIRDLVERGFVSTQKMQELAELKRELLSKENPELTNDELDETVNSQEVNKEIERISTEILNSNMADDFRGVLSSIPEADVDMFRNDPRMLDGLRHDVQSGLAGKIMPKVERLMVVDGMSFQEAYVEAGKAVNDSNNRAQTNMDRLSSGGSGSSAVIEAKQKDIWSMSDSEFRALSDTVRQ